MFKKKIEQPEPVVVEEKPRCRWKICGLCKKWVYTEKSGISRYFGSVIDTDYICDDTKKYTLSFKDWDKCDGYEPKHGCLTCNRVKYCKIGCMNKTYADEKITCIKDDDCPEWVILPEIDAMMKHDEV